MRIPSLKIRGDELRSNVEINDISTFLNSIGIYCFNKPRVNQSEIYYGIDDRGLGIRSNTLLNSELVSIDEFKNRLSEFYVNLVEWRTSLQVGDVVTIDTRWAPDDYYYPQYVKEMSKYVGTQQVIHSIELIPEHNLPYILGDYRRFQLENVPFLWHSSMFVMNIKPATVLKLSSIKIEL